MLRASLVITTVFVSALSAAATVFFMTSKSSDAPTPVVEFKEAASASEQGDQPKMQAELQADLPKLVSTLEQQVSELHQKLEDASAERAQLAETVVVLNRQIVDLESSTLNLASLASQQNVQSDTTSTTRENRRRGNGDGFRLGNESNAENRYENLLAVGVDASSAQNISDRLNQFQLERLELTDLAAREGWVDSEQYRERLRELRETRVDLREELGEDTYDAYLYNSGSNNRIVIESIIPGSAADTAGAQAGDLILSYANLRVFRVRELQQATRGGNRGEMVDVTLERQGQFFSVSVPRGPLGVSLDALRVSP